MADKTAAPAIKKHREPFIHIVKRDDMKDWQAWLVRIATIIAGI